jgi:hypothetical protein
VRDKNHNRIEGLAAILLPAAIGVQVSSAALDYRRPHMFIHATRPRAARSANQDQAAKRAGRRRAPARDLIAAVLFVVAAGACGGGGGCGACGSVAPLPGGKLPASQTIEGGAQIRVTPQGFATLTSIVKPLLDQQIGSANLCIPKDTQFLVDYCYTNQGTCTPGCRVVPTINTISVEPKAGNVNALHLHVDIRATAAVPLDFGFLGTCTINATIDHVVADLDVTLGIDPTTGRLTIRANPISSLTNSNPSLTGCSIVSGLLGLLVNLFSGTVTDFVRGQLQPAVDTLIDGLVNATPSLIGTLDVGNLLAGLSSNGPARLEVRLEPGGYAQTNGGGLSLGLIAGINADRDPATRTGAAASEPARCVPALAAPDLKAAPYSLPLTSRSTYALSPADAFNGIPNDPGSDIAMGISQTALDLAGHHVVTSGAACLGIGTSFVRQLNVGTIGLLVRSIGGLASDTGTSPLLLVTRPQRPLTFTIGDNTPASAAVTVGVDHMEIDFDAFLYERYVRIFTIDVSMKIGVNLEFRQVAGGAAEIIPTLTGIDTSQIKIKVLNSQFVKETPAELEAVLPSVFNLVTPLLGNLPGIGVPSFAGFTLGNLSIRHVSTHQDEFLALYGQLSPGAALRALLGDEPSMQSMIATADAALPAAPAASTGRARLVSVVTPDPERVRGALLGEPDGAVPAVTFDADRADAAGRELEWSYQLDGGMWRPWQAGAPLVIADPAFAWQGKYAIGLRSRVKDDYRTVGDTRVVPVIIDSVAPQILVDQAAWQGDSFELPAIDLVSGRAVRYAFGAPSRQAPQSAWTAGATIRIARDALAAYLEHGQLAVFATDEAGNTRRTLITPEPPPPSGGCAAGATPGTTVLLVIVVAGLVARRRAAAPARLRGRAVVTAALWTGGVLALASQPACSCNQAPAQAAACELDSDCRREDCAPSELAFCVDHTCVCSSDIPPGTVGPYSDVAVGADGAIWVSAYAQSHGDLVVVRATGAGRIPDEAWEWVDGVPAGPVTVPGSTIRRGIEAAGPDVGMYTSVAVGLDGVPMVSYFDRDTASLKLAQKINGAWQISVVDQGTGKLGDTGVLTGMYSSLTLRSDDGRPGIAYLAHVKDAQGARAEVRFMSAQTPHPQVAADWQSWVVDSAPLPAVDPANPPVYPLPEGLGLFVDAARLPTQAPVVVYYDRSTGDLKLARFNAPTGQFAAARVLDGSGGLDEGWAPSIAVDARGVVHVAYGGGNGSDLRYITDAVGAVPQVVDDGYRLDGTTVDGLPRPVFHTVGNDAGIILPPNGAGPLVSYQDATTQELLLGHKQPDGRWTHLSLAGATSPWPGGYGFFAAAAANQDLLVLSSWVVNVPASDYFNSNWVEVFSRPVNIP